MTGHKNKDLERWHTPLLGKQFVIASRVLPFLSVTICRAITSESDKTCHHASLSPASGRTSLRLQHLGADMAAPKALPITQGKLKKRSWRLYGDLFANKITGRHSPQGTIWLPHLPACNTP